MDQFLKILTGQYFSQLYYCTPLWLNSDTRWNLKRIINSAHYKGLRIAAKDFKKKQSRSLLDKECKRATPTQWGNYAVASLVIKTLKNNEPKFLKDSITTTLYTTRRKPLIGRFYNNAKGKIGKQALHNRLEMMDLVDFDWIGQDLSDDRIRTYLKRTFF